MSKVRMFVVGDLCVHKSYICRVDAVERVITGQNGYPSRAYMGVKDGTEFNPVLTITPLIGPGGNTAKAKAASKRRVSSGAVNTIAEAEKEIHDQIQKLQEYLILLKLPAEKWVAIAHTEHQRGGG